MDSDPIADFIAAEDDVRIQLMAAEAEAAAAAASIGGDASRSRTEDFDFTVNQQHSASRVFVYAWDLPRVFTDYDHVGNRSQRRDTKDDVSNALANYMVLLGEGDHFVYLTAIRYLESRWGSVGLAALQLFAAAVDRIKLGGNTVLNADESGFPFETRSGLETYVHFQLLPKLSERRRQLEIAIRWLCAVIRRQPSPESGPPTTRQGADGYQNFVWGTIADNSRTSDGDVCYELWPWSSKPRHSPSLKPSCWTDLFTRGVVVESPVPRMWGEGLETTFSIMVTLAGVENMYQIDGGVILLGFFTALVPISRNEKTNSIQWHLETSEAGIDPRHLECTKENWLRTVDTNMLKKARCFIGWFEKAHIMLGTRQLATDEARKLQWTGLKSRKETLRHVGREFGIQSGLTMGPINIVGQGVSTFAIVDNELRYSASQQFAQVLRLNSREVALVVDAESRRAWLVPLLSWILHLCHRYYIEQCGHGDTPIPFAEPSSDGAKAALSAVVDKGSTVIFGTATEDAETLRQLWLRISTNLRESQPGHEDPRKGIIFAAEAMDITMSQDSFPKEVPFSQASASWAEFAKLATTTTVCANLGNAIVPVPPSKKLCECCVLIEKQDFLAAHTWSLARLLQKKGRSFSQLGEKGLPFENGTCWRVGDGLQGLWTDCPAGDDCRNIWGANASMSPILQRLEKVDCQSTKGKDVEEELPVYDEQESEAGVVVFGGYQESNWVQELLWHEVVKSFNARFGSRELFPQRGVAGN